MARTVLREVSPANKVQCLNSNPRRTEQNNYTTDVQENSDKKAKKMKRDQLGDSNHNWTERLTVEWRLPEAECVATNTEERWAAVL